MDQQTLIEINDKIQRLKRAAEELNQTAGTFPALVRNTARILASLKMLEMNISDLLDPEVSLHIQERNVRSSA